MTIIKQVKVKTRKEHSCHGCARKFEKGSNLEVVTGTDAGEIFTTYWCGTCQSYWTNHMEPGDEIGFGELRSEDAKGWEIVRRSVEGVPEETV